MKSNLLIMRVSLLCCLALILIAPDATAQTKRKKTVNGEKLISALVNSKNVAGYYGDDGISIVFEAPEIQRILKLGRKAIPLLIAHLDDKRLLNMATNPNTSGVGYQITVGAASLDLLTMMIREDARFFDKKCLKELQEGLEAPLCYCVKKAYHVSYEDFWRDGKIRVSNRIVKAKSNWLKAYRKKQIHYEQKWSVD